MRELWIGTGSADSEKGEVINCDYSILVAEISGAVFFESYGVKVTCRETAEVSVFEHLTVNAQKILKLAESLHRNLVTPSGLEDVIADWL